MANPMHDAVAVIGSQTALAERLGVTPQAVQQWVTRAKPPPERVLEIERITGISRHALRPDVFGPGPAEQGRAA